MVLGHQGLDNGLSTLGQAFPVVVSEDCVLLKCSKAFFDEHIWKETLVSSMEVKLNHV